MAYMAYIHTHVYIYIYIYIYIYMCVCVCVCVCVYVYICVCICTKQKLLRTEYDLGLLLQALQYLSKTQLTCLMGLRSPLSLNNSTLGIFINYAVTSGK
jgi:hypothetical protein